MTDDDETPNPSGEADYDGTDPEVPFMPHHSSNAPHKHQQPHIEYHASHHYIEHSLEWIRNRFPFLCSGQFWTAFAALVTAAATAVTAVATIAMVLVYIQIKGVMDSQGGQTNQLIQAAKAQSCAAQQIANASDTNAAAAASFAQSAGNISQNTKDAVNQLQRAATDSENAIKQDQRAWFGISNFKVLQYDRNVPATPFRMQISFQNSGKTPARQIHIFGLFAVHESRSQGPSDAELKSLVTYFNQSTERYVAAPNAIRKYIAGDFGNATETAIFRNLFRQNFDSIADGSKFLCFYGQATYIDIWDRPHTTDFCVVLGDSKTKQLAHCGQGNDMN